MITPSTSRAIVLWLAGLPTLVVGPAASVQAQEGERHVILVNVLDRDGDQVPGLTAANFRGEYRGQPVTVVSAIEDRTPRRIAVILDRSGSQSRVGSPVLRSVQELIDAMTPQHSMVIGTVADSIRQYSELTNDRQVLEQALRDVAASRAAGYSSLRDAVLSACQGLHSTRSGDVVLLFSDCNDTTSAADPGRMVTAAAQTGVRVFAILTPGELGPWGAWTTATWMSTLAKATGGSVSQLESFEKELPSLLSMIAETYRLEVAFPQPLEEPRRWKLEVVGPDRKKLPKIRLIYPDLVSRLVPPK